MDETSSVGTRLSADARRLEVRLPPDALRMPHAVLLGEIQEQSARLGVVTPVTAADLEAALRSHRYGDWVTVLESPPPGAPVDGRVELLVPVPIASQRRAATYCSVHAGTPLARLRYGTAGAPGRDLLQRETVARPPRAARLPQGQNTTISSDGTLLLAACDGEVALHQLLLHVTPMRIHDGDLSGSITVPSGVVIAGSVRPGARIEAQGDVHVHGDAHGALIKSKSGSIAVGGNVLGTPKERTVLEASTGITCHRVLHGELSAKGDVRLLADARHTTVRTPGNVYLEQPIDTSLFDVRLHIGGGVIPVVEPPELLISPPTVRQYFRVPVALKASIALHGAPPLKFSPCTIADISANGARCHLSSALMGDPLPGTIMQLKFALPGDEDFLFIIARVARNVEPGMFAVAFIQLTQRDYDRLLTFCQRLLQGRRRKGIPLGTAADRRPD